MCKPEHSDEPELAETPDSPILTEFYSKPLGFKIQSGINGCNAYVVDVTSELKHLMGRHMIQIDKLECTDLPFSKIEEILATSQLPISLTYAKIPTIEEDEEFHRDHVDTWTPDQVTLWWSQAFPAPLQPYVSIIDDCNIDGSDLRDVDAEMLHEFHIKRIHAMKILNEIKKLLENDHVMVYDFETGQAQSRYPVDIYSQIVLV